MNFKKYNAFLFDMDGTLVDSEPLKGKALSEACSHYGPAPDYHIYKSVMGGSWPFVTKHFFKAAHIRPNMDEFNHHFRSSNENLLRKEARLIPYAKEFLDRLIQQGKETGVVSSAATWMVEQILQQLEIADMFDVIISQEDVIQHKPHPEAYILAIKQLSLDSNDVLIFEDSSAGLQAARAVNCDVVAIQHEFNAENDLSLAIETVKDFRFILSSFQN